MKKITVLLFLSLSVLMVSCGKNTETPPPGGSPEASPTTSPSP